MDPAVGGPASSSRSLDRGQAGSASGASSSRSRSKEPSRWRGRRSSETFHVHHVLKIITVGGQASSSRSPDRGQAGSASGASRPSRQWRQPPMEISRLRRVGGLGFSAMCRTLRLTRSPRVDRPLLRIGGVNLVKQADDDEDVSTETEEMMKEVPGLKGAMLYARRRRIGKQKLPQTKWTSSSRSRSPQTNAD